jgi:hypothetical protein
MFFLCENISMVQVNLTMFTEVIWMSKRELSREKGRRRKILVISARVAQKY